MLGRISLIVLLVFAALCACGSMYLYRTQAGPDGELVIRHEMDGSQLLVEGKKGRIYFNGWDHGPVAEGDEVEIRTPGELFVNGEQRKPTEN